MSIVFYWYPFSSASPIACALAELQVPHERVKVDLKAGEQRRPEFLALNPNGKVPTLTVDGAPLFEALAIHLWLAEHWGVKQGLWPADGTPERLAAMSWCSWAYVTYGAAVWRLQHAAHGAEQYRDARQAEAAIADLDGLLGLLDSHLTPAVDAGRGLFAGRPGGVVGGRLHRVPGGAGGGAPQGQCLAGQGEGPAGHAGRGLRIRDRAGRRGPLPLTSPSRCRWPACRRRGS